MKKKQVDRVEQIEKESAALSSLPIVAGGEPARAEEREDSEPSRKDGSKHRTKADKEGQKSELSCLV